MADSSTAGPFTAYGGGAAGRLAVVGTVAWAICASVVPRLASAGDWAEAFVVPELVALSVTAYIGFFMAVALSRSVVAGFVLAVLPLTVGPPSAVTLLFPLGAVTLLLAWSHARRPRQSSLWTQGLCIGLAASIAPIWGGVLGAAAAFGIVARFGRTGIRSAAAELLRYGGVVAVSMLLVSTLAVTDLLARSGLVDVRSAVASGRRSGAGFLSEFLAVGGTVGGAPPTGAQFGSSLAPAADLNNAGRIVVRWVSGLPPEEQIGIALDHGLTDPAFLSDATSSYLAADDSMEELRRLRVHSAVEEIQRDDRMVGPEDDIVRARVFVRWIESVTDADRQQGELQYGLPTAVQRVGRTWAYRVDDPFDLDHVSADMRVERVDSVQGNLFAAKSVLSRIRDTLLGLSPRRMDASLAEEESASDSVFATLVSILHSGLTRVVVLGFLVVAGLSYLSVVRRRMPWRPEDVLLVASLTLCVAGVLGPRTAGAAVSGMTLAGACLVSRFKDARNHPGTS